MTRLAPVRLRHLLRLLFAGALPPVAGGLLFTRRGRRNLRVVVEAPQPLPFQPVADRKLEDT